MIDIQCHISVIIVVLIMTFVIIITLPSAARGDDPRRAPGAE